MRSVNTVLGLDQKKEKCRRRFEELLAEATEPKAETLDAVERRTFMGLMEVGRLLLEARLEGEAARDEASEVVDPRGRKLAYHSHKPVSCRSVFGEIEVERAYYRENGCGEGFCVECRALYHGRSRIE